MCAPCSHRCQMSANAVFLCYFLVWPSFQIVQRGLLKLSLLEKGRNMLIDWFSFLFFNHWLLGNLHLESGLLALFLLQIPQWKQVHKQKEKSMDCLWQLWERCLASQSVCLRWTSQSVLWCCSIALFTSASCFKPIWSEAHRVLTTISTSENSLPGTSRSIWPLKWFLSSVEHLYIPARVF